MVVLKKRDYHWLACASFYVYDLISGGQYGSHEQSELSTIKAQMTKPAQHVFEHIDDVVRKLAAERGKRARRETLTEELAVLNTSRSSYKHAAAYILDAARY